MRIRIEKMSPATAASVLGGERPQDIVVADDYPTEFSTGVAAQVGKGGLGPYVVYAPDHTVVVGEIGGGFVAPATVEIGYAVVRSHWGRGIATAAVIELVRRLRDLPQVQLVIAHTPLDRPESGRVLSKAGFTRVGERDDEHEGMTLRVQRWERRLRDETRG